MSNQTQIKCPKCGASIEVQNILSHQIEDEVKQKYQSQIAEEQKKHNADLENLKQTNIKLEEAKKQEQQHFQEQLNIQLKENSKTIEKKLKLKLLEEQSEQFALMQGELHEKSEKLKEFNRTKSEVEKLKREKSEQKIEIEAQAEKKLTEVLLTETQKVKKNEEEKNELRFKELHKQIEDQKNLAQEMRRKQEQGSMQLQGEVQELAIEKYLAEQFPLDTIEEIKKGVRGGDCIQIVNTRSTQNCGSIYYESKRTQDFSLSWIEKFKADIRDKEADIGVLVTKTMPSDMKRMGLKNGVWVCNYEEFKGLCCVLRESLIQINTVLSSQENKGDKIEMLYNYLTSDTFRRQVEAIAEGFIQMRKDLDAEKRAMQLIWKKREKQLEKATVNTIDMYASIKGIAGDLIQSVKTLELSDENF